MPPAPDPRNRRRSFRCLSGWHDPAAAPLWNDGHYFAVCHRCGRDIVRTAVSRWTVPRGFRVVWQQHPPRPGVRGPGGEPMVEPQFELPIERVLRTLRERSIDDGTAETAVTEDDAARRSPPIDDFMADDDAATMSWDSWDRPRAEPRPEAEAGASDQVLPVGGIAPERVASLRRGFRLRRRVGVAARRARHRLRAGAQGATLRIRSARMARAGLYAIILIACLPFAYIGLRMSDPAALPAEPGSAVAASSSSRQSPGGAIDKPRRPAFVAARLLNCRDAPAREGRTVRTFARGEAVTRLARDGDWLSIAHQGRQCWVAARYVTDRPPL